LSNKRITAIILILGGPLLQHGELIRKSSLLRPRIPFSIARDLFAARPAGMAGGETPKAATEQVKEKQKTIQEEISQSILYEGYLIKNGKKTALLSVSGDFFYVGEGDSILDKIKVIGVSREAVIIEYENQKFEIKLKGEENG
jgi:hypothetical protein